ncbi:hypothetical protein [Novosphingobium sp. PP1Y]|uniref:hypothetical protein n=1 Tax=Novosphingobium sp. PP1Y TaxID=702113 RepID=UPI0011D29E15|nr:hypothetical protein [Novosphingobium sp. PP1Y]
MADLRKRERSRAEIRLAKIAVLDWDAAITTAADKAALGQQIAALHATSKGDHVIASARKADLLGLLDDMWAVAAVDTMNRLEASAQKARLRTLIREDAQAGFDRLMEGQRAKQAAAAPSLHKVDARRVGPHARQILQRMQTAGGSGGHA